MTTKKHKFADQIGNGDVGEGGVLSDTLIV